MRKAFLRMHNAHYFGYESFDEKLEVGRVKIISFIRVLVNTIFSSIKSINMWRHHMKFRKRHILSWFYIYPDYRYTINDKISDMCVTNVNNKSNNPHLQTRDFYYLFLFVFFHFAVAFSLLYHLRDITNQHHILDVFCGFSFP